MSAWLYYSCLAALVICNLIIGYAWRMRHEDLNEATHQALHAMLDLMGERLGLERKEALALASLVVDLRVTQIANGTLGVHACLPHDAISSGSGPPASGRDLQRKTATVQMPSPPFSATQ